MLPKLATGSLCFIPAKHTTQAFTWFFVILFSKGAVEEGTGRAVDLQFTARVCAAVPREPRCGAVGRARGPGGSARHSTSCALVWIYILIAVL